MDWGRERPALYGLGDDNDKLYGGLTGRGRRALWGLRDNNDQLYEDWGLGRPAVYRLGATTTNSMETEGGGSERIYTD